MASHNKSQAGFTLIEMIVVIVITGIIAGIVAVFLQAPVQGYVDSARRAELTDIADTALRRMTRDVRTAVPNSVRIAACTGTCVEFLPTKDGGRYRANSTGGGAGCGAAGSTLEFYPTADTCFEIVGTGIDFAVGDQIVLGSTQSDGNLPYNINTAVVSGVLSAYNGAAGVQTNVTITNDYGLPPTARLSSQRFDVVDGAQQAVTYACVAAGGGACTTSGGNGTCQLLRYSNYNFQATQKTPAQIAAGANSVAVLADNVSDCQIVYDLPNTRFGLVAVRLTLTSGGESVSLYNEIHVNNAP